jgi:sugar/nucleoside kinase (ribokinase family)
MPAFNVDVVETTGAGDSFDAGFIHSYLKGNDCLTCLKFGNACGALAVTSLGGTTAFINKNDVKSRLKEMLSNDSSNI